MNEFGKICATARVNASLTQEQAAPMLGVATRTLSAYECGKFPIPEDIVLKMMDLYNNQWLGYLHLKLDNEIGKVILPEIPQRALSANVLDLQIEMDQASSVQKQLAEVGRDDLITPDEVPVFNSCVSKLKKLCGPIFAIACTAVKKERPPVLAHRRQ